MCQHSDSMAQFNSNEDELKNLPSQPDMLSKIASNDKVCYKGKGVLAPYKLFQDDLRAIALTCQPSLQGQEVQNETKQTLRKLNNRVHAKLSRERQKKQMLDLKGECERLQDQIKKLNDKNNEKVTVFSQAVLEHFVMKQALTQEQLHVCKQKLQHLADTQQQVKFKSICIDFDQEHQPSIAQSSPNAKRLPDSPLVSAAPSQQRNIPAKLEQTNDSQSMVEESLIQNFQSNRYDNLIQASVGQPSRVLQAQHSHKGRHSLEVNTKQSSQPRLSEALNTPISLQGSVLESSTHAARFIPSAQLPVPDRNPYSSIVPPPAPSPLSGSSASCRDHSSETQPAKKVGEQSNMQSMGCMGQSSSQYVTSNSTTHQAISSVHGQPLQTSQQGDHKARKLFYDPDFAYMSNAGNESQSHVFQYQGDYMLQQPQLAYPVGNDEVCTQTTIQQFYNMELKQSQIPQTHIWQPAIRSSSDGMLRPMTYLSQSNQHASNFGDGVPIIQHRLGGVHRYSPTMNVQQRETMLTSQPQQAFMDVDLEAIQMKRLHQFQRKRQFSG